MNQALREVLIKQSEIEHEERLKNGVVGGLKKGESIIDYLTDEEIKKIWDYYDPITALKIIDKTDDIIKARIDQKPIKYVYMYVKKIADKYF